jgi:NADH-quinone oxidoreductase subunit J
VSVETIAFYGFAAGAIVAALLMILYRNPVMSAIALIANFFCLAALYLILRAQFLAVIQIIVYTGAIMVLVVFVIMLLNLQDEQRLAERFDVKNILGTVLAFGFVLEMLYLFGVVGGEVRPAVHPLALEVGSVEGIGGALFGRFLLPFEATSFLLLAAIVGAVVLARRKA